MSQGAALAGAEDGVGYEWDEHAAATARAAGHKRVVADIADLKPRELHRNGVRWLHGSPPCEGFSFSGQGVGRGDTQMLLQAIEAMSDGGDPDRVLALARIHAKDKRSPLSLEPLRWAMLLEPTAITLEQVPPVRRLWGAYAVALERRGYSVATGIGYSEQHGAPQNRERAILLASREREVAMPAASHSRYYRQNPGRLDEGVPRWSTMAEGLDWDEAAIRERLVNPAGGEIDTWPLRRPSTTIVGSFRPDIVRGPGYRKKGDGPSQNAPGGVRVTLAEAGVLQSFPADYPWQGPENARRRQVGDAVPPLLGKAMVEAVLE